MANLWFGRIQFEENDVSEWQEPYSMEDEIFLSYQQTDTTTAADIASVSVEILQQDSFSVAEVLIRDKLIPLIETATGSESPLLKKITTLLQTGSSSDLFSIINRLSRTDSGSGADVPKLTTKRTIQQTASGAEVLANKIMTLIQQAGHGTDAASLKAYAKVTDTATDSEVVRQVKKFTGTDTGAGIDSFNLVVKTTVQQAGSGSDVIASRIAAFIQQTGSGVDAASMKHTLTQREMAGNLFNAVYSQMNHISSWGIAWPAGGDTCERSTDYVKEGEYSFKFQWNHVGGTYTDGGFLFNTGTTVRKGETRTFKIWTYAPETFTVYLSVTGSHGLGGQTITVNPVWEQKTITVTNTRTDGATATVTFYMWTPSAAKVMYVDKAECFAVDNSGAVETPILTNHLAAADTGSGAETPSLKTGVVVSEQKKNICLPNQATGGDTRANINDWFSWSYNGSVTTTYTTEDKYSGNGCIKNVQNYAGTNGYRVCGWVNVKPNKQYTVSAWMKSSVAINSNIEISWYSAEGKYIGGSWGGSSEITDWTQKYVTGTSPAQSAYCHYSCWFPNAPQNQIGYVDQVQFEEGGEITSWVYPSMLESRELPTPKNKFTVQQAGSGTETPILTNHLSTSDLGTAVDDAGKLIRAALSDSGTDAESIDIADLIYRVSIGDSDAFDDMVSILSHIGVSDAKTALNEVLTQKNTMKVFEAMEDNEALALANRFAATETGSGADVPSLKRKSTILEYAPSNTGLVGYWRMNEDSGDDVFDSGYNGLNGTLINTPTRTNGIKGGSLLLDGINQGVSINDAPSLTISEATVNIWFKWDGIRYPATESKDWMTLVLKGTSYSSNEYCILVNRATGTTNTEIRWYVNGVSKVSTSSKVIDTDWHMLTCTVTGSSTKVYYDGQYVLSGSGSAIPNNPSPFKIGYGGATYYGFGGQIDETLLYNRELTATEIALLYSEGVKDSTLIKNKFTTPDTGSGAEVPSLSTKVPITEYKKNMCWPTQAMCGDLGEGYLQRWGVDTVRTLTNSTSWNGSYSVKVDIVTGGGYGCGDASIAVVPGRQYTASAYIKGDVGKQVLLQVGKFNINKSYMGSNLGSSQVTLTSDWQRITFTFTAPSDVHYISCYVGNYTGNLNFTFYVDGYQVEEGDTATDWSYPSMRQSAERPILAPKIPITQSASGSDAPTIKNKFTHRDHLTRNKIPAAIATCETAGYWQRWNENTDCMTASIDYTDSYQGYGCAKCEYIGTRLPYAEIVSNLIYTLEANKTYTVSAYVKSVTGKSGSLFAYYFTPAGGYISSLGSQSVTFNGDWQRVSFTFTGSNNFGWFRLATKVDNPSLGDTIKIDCAQVEEGNTLTDYVYPGATDTLSILSQLSIPDENCCLCTYDELGIKQIVDINEAVTPAELLTIRAALKILESPVGHENIQTGYITRLTASDAGTIAEATAIANRFVIEEYKRNLVKPNIATGTDAKGDTSDGWSAYGTGITISSSTEQAHMGSRSLKTVTIGSVNGEGCQMSAMNNMTFGQRYTLSFWAYAENGVKLRVAFGDIATNTWAGWTGNGAWQKITVSHTQNNWPANYATPRMNFAIITDTTQACTFYVDEVQLEEGDTATDWIFPSIGRVFENPITTKKSLITDSKQLTDLITLENAFAVADSLHGVEAPSLKNRSTIRDKIKKNICTPNQATGGFIYKNTTDFTPINKCTAEYSTEQIINGKGCIKTVSNNATNADSFIGLGGDAGDMRLGMIPGNTYTVSAWIYVPSATGLSPEDSRGLRINFYTTMGVASNTRSNPPTVTDQWVKLSVTKTIPAGNSDAFIRLYNGWQTAGKVVYWGEIQVEQGNTVTDWEYPGLIDTPTLKTAQQVTDTDSGIVEAPALKITAPIKDNINKNILTSKLAAPTPSCVGYGHGWYSWGGLTLSYDPNVKRLEYGSLKLSGGGSMNLYDSDFVPSPFNGQRVTFSVYYKSNANVTMAVASYKDDGSWSGQGWVTTLLTPTNEWTRVSVTYDFASYAPNFAWQFWSDPDTECYLSGFQLEKGSLTDFVMPGLIDSVIQTSHLSVADAKTGGVETPSLKNTLPIYDNQRNILTPNQATCTNANLNVTGFNITGNGTIESSTERAYQGARSLKVTGSSGGGSNLGTCYLKAYQAETFSGKIYVPSGKTVRITFGSYNTTITGNNDWQDFSVTNTRTTDGWDWRYIVSWDGSTTIFYVGELQQNKSSGALPWAYPGGADVPILKTAQKVSEYKKNIVKPNNATGTDTTGTTTLFTVLYAGATLTSTTSEAWQGTRSLQVDTPGTRIGEGVYCAAIPVKSNTQYTGSIYIKGSGTVVFAWNNRDINSNVIGASNQSAPITLTNEWQRVTVTATSDVNAAYFYFRIATYSTIQAITFYTDGWQMEEGGTATTWEHPSIGQDLERPSLINRLKPTDQASVIELATLIKRLRLIDAMSTTEYPYLRETRAIFDTISLVDALSRLKVAIPLTETGTTTDSAVMLGKVSVDDDGIIAEGVSILSDTINEYPIGTDDVYLKQSILKTDSGILSDALRLVFYMDLGDVELDLLFEMDIAIDEAITEEMVVETEYEDEAIIRPIDDDEIIIEENRNEDIVL